MECSGHEDQFEIIYLDNSQTAKDAQRAEKEAMDAIAVAQGRYFEPLAILSWATTP